MANWEKISDKSYKLKFKDEDIFIGDESDQNFKPKVKLKRWGGECSFDLELVTSDVIISVIEDGKLKQKKTNDYEIIFDVDETDEGSFSFDILLHKKWKDDVMVFDINLAGLTADYQPPLTESPEILQGLFPRVFSVTETECFDEFGEVVVTRPEKVVGSYVLMHSTKKGHAVGKTNYKAGQAGILYRPRAIDDNGVEHWITQEIVGSQLLLDLNDDWFKNEAKYPVYVDPTFGYTTVGGSNTPADSNWWVGYQDAPGDGDGLVDSVHIYQSGGAGEYFKGVMVLASNRNIIANGVSPAQVGSTGPAWVVCNYSSKPAVTDGTNYYIGIISDAVQNWYYNLTGSIQEDSSNSYSSPTNPTDSNPYPVSFSLYATYNPAPVDTWVPRVIFID